MISNWEIIASVLFYFGSKFICYMKMYKQNVLNSIPERSEVEEDSNVKWVPKKKHEVLKAKYKCLKKLFQIYDASVIGIFPESTIEFDDTTKRRRKRSHRTKTDACAGTNELSTYYTQSECNLTANQDNDLATTTSMQDLKLKQSCSTQIDIQKFMNDSQCEPMDSKYEMNASVVESFDNSKCKIDNNLLMLNRGMDQSNQFYLNERRRLTRFQCFIQRVFGIKRDAASDSAGEKRRRRGLRFRRLKRSKKILSESNIKDLGDSAILSYVQSIQRSCLMNTTPRQCPYTDCRMVSYGIINYNDHLNLCHFKDRKYICHYCHEGFEREQEKLMHEHEHIGLNRLSGFSGINNRCRSLPASNTHSQDDEPKVSEEKLKKIVSFFDKITSQGAKCAASEDANSAKSDSDTNSEKRLSSMHIVKCACACESSHASDVASEAATEAATEAASDASSLTCIYCGEHFNYRRQLKNHVDTEHRKSNRFAKSHSCAVLDKPHLRFDERSQSQLPSFAANSQSTLDRRPHDLMFRNETHRQRDRFENDSQNSDAQDSRKSRGKCRFEGCRSESSQIRRPCDGKLNVLTTVDSSRAKQIMSLRSSTTMSEDSLTPSKSQESLATCDPSNIVYYTSSMASVKPSMTSVAETLLRKMKSYRWEPGTNVIRA